MEACLLHSWQVQGNACTLLYPTLRLSQWTFGWIKLWKDRVFNFVQYSQIRWPRTVTAKPNTSQQKQSSFGFAVGICFCREVFAVKYLVLPWGIWFLLRSIWFCREVFGFAVRFFCFCREVFGFAVMFLFFEVFGFAAWGILFLPWGFQFCREVFCFCRELFDFAVTVVGHRSQT